MPTKEELNWIYVNLKKTGQIIDYHWYWSSSSDSTDNAWVQSFYDGTHLSIDKDNTNSIFAVRAFDASNYDPDLYWR